MSADPGTIPLTGIPVNLPLLSANFPSLPDAEFPRDNIVSTLKNLLAENTYAVSVEGPEGIGKTTLLSQFVRKTPSAAISLYISPANRLSHDIDLMRLDLTTQVYWILTSEVLAPAQCDPTQLKTHYLNLQRLAKRRNETIYFIVDGLEDLNPPDRKTLLHQLADVLPIGVPQFRFLFSGDESLYKTLIGPRLLLKSFPLTEFGIEETRALFSSHNMSVDVIRDLNNICRGMPGRLAGVLRALNRGLSIDEFIQDPPLEIFEVDWKQIDQ
jgi:hypothetical protein